MKICFNPKCFFAGRLQPLDNFCKDKSKKNGLHPRCRTCKKEYDDSHKQQRNSWEQQHKEERKIYLKNYRSTHKLQRKNNREKNKPKRNKREVQRRKEDINFRIECNLRSRLSIAIRGNFKSGSSVRDMECSIEFLKEYFKPMFSFVLEENEMMCWENYPRLWEIDHIVPLSAFDLTNREELLKAVHYTNLRPMWVSKNRSEQDRGLRRGRKQ